MQQITGKTYPVKDQLKAMGARWNARAKAWEIADELAPAAWAVVWYGPHGWQGVCR